MVNCPICGKLTCIHWPEHWIYRRGSTYYCGEQCMSTDLFRDMQLLNEVNRRKRKEIIMTKITLEQKKKAVEIAISGGNPLAFLKKMRKRCAGQDLVGDQGQAESEGS